MDKFRKQMLDTVGMGDAFKGMEDHAKRNMALFNDAMKMFNPFATMMAANAGGAAKPDAAQGGGASKDDLQTLKEQMAAMQHKLDTMSR